MRRLGVSVATMVLLGCPWASASADAATVVNVECTSNADFSSTEVVDTYAPCTSTDSTLKSGRRYLASSPTDPCGPVAGTTVGQDDILWNNGEVSTWEYTREVTSTNGSIRIHQEGKITAGLFAGNNASEDLTVLLPGVYVHNGPPSVQPDGEEGDEENVADRNDNCGAGEGGGGGGAADRRLTTGKLLITP